MAKIDTLFMIKAAEKPYPLPPPGGGGGVLGFSFAGYVPLASHSPCLIIVYFVASYRPHLSHFWESVIFAIPTKSLSIYASTLSIL